VPKHMLEPAKNQWLLAPPSSSETQPKTQPE
jgi:hypothetical protein